MLQHQLKKMPPLLQQLLRINDKMNIKYLHISPVKQFVFSHILLLMLSASGYAQPGSLWYNSPAQKWTEALPLGNGSLGAMVYGGVETEHIQFNEQTLWTGKPRDYQRNGAVQFLKPIRQLLFDGRQAEAEALAGKAFMGLKDVDDSQYSIDKQNWLVNVRSDESLAAAALDDKAWPQIPLLTPNGWEAAGMEGVDGAVWFRTTFELPAAWAGKKLQLDLGRIRDADYTYINGKLVGNSEGISTKRRYVIDAAVLKPGTNQLAIQVINFFDKGGFTGIKENNKVFVIYPLDEGNANAVALNTTWKYYIQNDAPPAYPQYQASYQPFGDIFMDIAHTGPVKNYRRELQLSNAVHKITYEAGTTSFERTYFASHPGKAFCMQIKANKPGAVSITTKLTSPHKNYILKKIDKHTISITVQVKNGALHGVAYLSVNNNGGELTITDSSIRLEAANSASVVLTAATNFVNYKDVTANAAALCAANMQAVSTLSFQHALAEHIKDYQNIWGDFSIDLGKPSGLPVDERIRAFANHPDPSLAALLVQYARYLMIASSRPGTQPGNLQGIWNDLLTPPWGSKYTSNINLQMNYWPAEVLGLAACTEPLFNMISELRQTGNNTAREHYGAPGWVLHHNTDLWRGTAPINASNHGIWVTGAAWLSHHIWEHYMFTNDKLFLQSQYPAMKEAAQFFLHFLVKDPQTGWYISTPSNSPEQGGLVAGPTMDHQIIRQLFKDCIDAAGVLQTDEDFTHILKNKYDSIAPNKIGRYGQLQEWMQDVDDTTNKHRHVSHLWGVYPGQDITFANKPLMDAARQSLLYRGDDGTGWSLAWKINLWARFLDGEHAFKILQRLFEPAETSNGGEQGGLYKNMFDAHPPFQIDGNFGAAAGIAEMLVQSHLGMIHLLPALPRSFGTGAVRGFKARGGFTLNFAWNNMQLTNVTVTGPGSKCVLKFGEKTVVFQTIKGKTYHFDGNLKNVTR